jgi:hypothetical protein
LGEQDDVVLFQSRRFRERGTTHQSMAIITMGTGKLTPIILLS